jgi:hypothetical protein
MYAYSTEREVPGAREYASAPPYPQEAYFPQRPTPHVILAVRTAPPAPAQRSADPCVVVCVAVCLIVVLAIIWTAILP